MCNAMRSEAMRMRPQLSITLFVFGAIAILMADVAAAAVADPTSIHFTVNQARTRKANRINEISLSSASSARQRGAHGAEGKRFVCAMFSCSAYLHKM